MQVDASDEVGIGGTSDGPNPWLNSTDSNLQLDNTCSESQLNDAHLDDAAIDREETDDEYGSWGGFGSSAYLSLPSISIADLQILTCLATPVEKTAQSGMKKAQKSLKDKIATKTGGKNPSAGKKSGKRKAPNVVEKYVAHRLSCASM